MKEFRIEPNPDKGNMLAWFVVWSGCDGRVVAWCCKRPEAQDICEAMNTSKIAEKWYQRAKVGIAMSQPEGT